MRCILMIPILLIAAFVCWAIRDDEKALEGYL